MPYNYTENPLLGQWVKTQREQYSCYQKLAEIKEKYRGIEVMGDEVKAEFVRLTRRVADMTEKRFKLLDAEDFVWDVPAHAWESRFQELRAFAALNGHAVILERKGGKYSPLAAWAAKQRQHYKNHER